MFERCYISYTSHPTTSISGSFVILLDNSTVNANLHLIQGPGGPENKTRKNTLSGKRTHISEHRFYVMWWQFWKWRSKGMRTNVLCVCAGCEVGRRGCPSGGRHMHSLCARSLLVAVCRLALFMGTGQGTCHMKVFKGWRKRGDQRHPVAPVVFSNHKMSYFRALYPKCCQ